MASPYTSSHSSSSSSMASGRKILKSSFNEILHQMMTYHRTSILCWLWPHPLHLPIPCHLHSWYLKGKFIEASLISASDNDLSQSKHSVLVVASPFISSYSSSSSSTASGRKMNTAVFKLNRMFITMNTSSGKTHYYVNLSIFYIFYIITIITKIIQY